MDGQLHGWVGELALAYDHRIHHAHRSRGGGINCSYACAHHKKQETEKTKKTAGDTKKKSAFTEAQKKDCRDLRATFLHAYKQYATGALRAFNDKVACKGQR